MPTNRTPYTVEDCMAAIIDYRGKTPKKTQSGVPLVTAKIIKGGRIEEPQEFIAESDFDSWMRRGIPEPGDIVLTTEAPLGEVAQLGPERIALAQRVITLRGKSGLLDNTFLKYLLQSTQVREALISRASGTTVVGIKQSELRKVELLLPPITEQKGIAHILGTLDNKIELNRRINQTLEAMAQAIFKSWFVDFEPVKAKAAAKAAGASPEAINRAAMAAITGKNETELDQLPESQQQSLAQTAALFPDSFINSELGKIPEGWAPGKLCDIIELIGGGTPKRSEPAYWGGVIPWFSVKDAPSEGDVYVLDTHLKITRRGLDESSTKLLNEGTTIISARGTVGRLALVGQPMAMNQSCYGVIGANGLPSIFTHFNLRHAVEILQQNTHGAVFDTITRSTFEAVDQIIPSKTVVERFEQFAQPFLSQIKINGLQNRTLAQIRDTLLPKLLSGDLSVSNAETKNEKNES